MSEWDNDAIERLVLAAPEVFKLLQWLADGYEGNDEQRDNEFWHLTQAAKALLAKIEGGEA